MNNHVYILVRQDLPKSQIVVQSSHLAWEIACGENPPQHPNMVVIGVKCEKDLLEHHQRLTSLGVNVYHFVEPLFENTVTSIGFYTQNEDERLLMKKFPLLKI